MAKDKDSKVLEMIAAPVEAAGYELVRAQVQGSGKYAALQIMVDRKDGKSITVEDCARVSRAISDILEADPDYAERYGLEVSSPGIDRPLVKLADYARFAGHMAKVELAAPMEGLRKFQGEIVKVAGENIDFMIGKNALCVPFEKIVKAKLVLTDALLKAAAGGKK